MRSRAPAPYNADFTLPTGQIFLERTRLLAPLIYRVTLVSPARIRTAVYCAAAVLLIFEAFWSVRLARADYDAAQPDLAGLTRACQLAPQAANYWLRFASIREVDQPADPAVDAAIGRSIALNPRYTEAWIARAFREETQGRIADAERDYLAAAKVDRMYKPAWALANFYVRQGRTDRFWFYARKCLEVVEPRRLEPASYDPAPVFDLAWRVTQDASEIRSKLIPRRHFILVDYLDYLGARNLTDAGADIAMDVAPYGDPADNYFLLNFCERLINLSNLQHPAGRRAMEIWNAMVARGTVRGELLDPARGQSLTNGDLKRPFEHVSFDWQMPPAEGVLCNHFPDAGEVRFDFSGDQPEGVLVFYQSVPVVPGDGYRLLFQYRTENMDHADGMTWQVWDYANQHVIPVTSRLIPHAEWTAGEAAFTIPRGVFIARLGLVCQRASGTTRIRGTAAFRGFSLRLDKPRGAI